MYVSIHVAGVAFWLVTTGLLLLFAKIRGERIEHVESRLSTRSKLLDQAENTLDLAEAEIADLKSKLASYAQSLVDAGRKIGGLEEEAQALRERLVARPVVYTYAACSRPHKASKKGRSARAANPRWAKKRGKARRRR